MRMRVGGGQATGLTISRILAGWLCGCGMGNGCGRRARAKAGLRATRRSSGNRDVVLERGRFVDFWGEKIGRAREVFTAAARGGDQAPPIPAPEHHHLLGPGGSAPPGHHDWARLRATRWPLRPRLFTRCACSQGRRDALGPSGAHLAAALDSLSNPRVG